MQRVYPSMLLWGMLVVLAAGSSPVWAKSSTKGFNASPGLKQQALTRLNHLDQAYGQVKTRVSRHRVGPHITEITNTSFMAVDAARPLISVGRLNLLHWPISSSQAVERATRGKPVRLGIRSSSLTTAGGERHDEHQKACVSAHHRSNLSTRHCTEMIWAQMC